LLEAVVEPFAVEQAEGCDRDCHQTVNKNHGRIETRRCGVLGTPEYLLKVLSNQNAIALAPPVGGPVLSLPTAAGCHFVNYHCSISRTGTAVISRWHKAVPAQFHSR